MLDIYPCEDERNTIVVVTFNTNGKHNSIIHESKSLAELLVVAGVEHMFSHLEGVEFGGTNTIVLSDRIVYIKENNIELFSEDAVRSNVMTLAKHRIGRA